MSKFNFWAWFDKVTADAAQTAVGKTMTAAGYHVAHTGGGCLVWEKTLSDGGYLWICDAGNGLGESATEPYLVGCYDKEGEIIAQDEMANLHSALEWCHAHLHSPTPKPEAAA
jgi:hypothetical protein